ncbi:MAG: hypothetical protein RR367_11650, partial [Clostridia bacterium]
MLRKLLPMLRRTSVSRRLLSLFLLQTIVIALWCFSMVRSSVHDFEEGLRFTGAQIVRTASAEMEQAFGEMEMLTKFPVMQAAYGRTSVFHYLGDTPQDSLQLVNYYRSIQAELLNVLVLYSGVSVLGISNLSGNAVYCLSDATAYNLTTLTMQSALAQQAIAANGSMLVMPGARLAELAPAISGENTSIFGVRALMKMNHFAAVGLVLCCIDLSNITRSFELERPYEQQTLCIWDEQGTQLLGEPVEDVGGAPTNAGGLIYMRDAQGEAVYQTYRNEQGMTILLRTPRSCMLDAMQERLTGLVILLVLFVLSILLITRFLVMSIREPMDKLMDMCVRIRGEDFSPAADEGARDEMHSLIESFSLMTAHIQRLIEEV